MNFALYSGEVPERLDYLTDEEMRFVLSYNFKNLIDDIDILFHEVYADICMLHILNLETNDYIESLLQEMDMYPNEKNISDEMFVIRIYVTLKASQMNWCKEKLQV